MIHCYIFGDNSTKQIIDTFIPTLSPVFYLGWSVDFRTAFKEIALNRPDIIFVDKELVNVDPFEIILLKQISPVLFTTSIKNEAGLQESKKDLKPSAIVQPEVEQMLEEAGIARSGNRSVLSGRPVFPKTIIIKTNAKGVYGGIEVIIKLKEIIYIESFKNYIDIHLDGNRTYRCCMALKRIEDELSDNFERVNRSFIINLNRITSIEGNDFLILDFNEKNRIPIGPTYKGKFTDWKSKRKFRPLAESDDLLQ